MAIKIVSLPALTVQDSTDIYEVSKNGTGSFKETRAQMQSYIQSNIDLYSTYLAGANANIDLQDSRPLAIFELSPVVERNSVTTQSTGLNTVANYRILGTVITIPNPIYVYALQYDVSLLPSGSTTVGIYDYDSQTLIVSDTVSVTDPIDSTGKFYTKTLGSPVLILGGPIVLTVITPANFSNFTNADAVANPGLAFVQWATGDSSTSPITLSFPTTFHNVANFVQAGSFIYSQYFIQENFTFNDSLTNPYALVSCDSVTRGSQPVPVMSTSEYQQITSYLGVMVVTNDLTPNRLVLHDQGGAWNKFAFVQDIILQNAYDNSITGLITVLNDNSKAFAIGNDETNIFGSYGVYVSATRNLSINPTEKWFHFFEANDSLDNMVQYGALACKALDTTSGSVSGITDIDAAVGTSGGQVLPFLSANGLTENSYSYYPFSISDTGLSVDPSSMFDITTTSAKGSRPYTLKTTTQRNAIVSPAIGLQVYNTATNTIDYFDGSAWQTGLSIAHLDAGTNITITDNGDGTVTIASAGTSFSVGGGAAFNISSGSITTFANSNYTPINCNVNFSTATNMTVNSNGSVTCNQNGTYVFNYILSARAASSTNGYNFAIFKNGVLSSETLQAQNLSSSPIPGASTIAVIGKFTLVAGDVIQLYVQNSQTLAINLITQNMYCNVSQDLASSSTLQSAYNNGSLIQGNQNVNPVTINNSTGTTLLTFNESGTLVKPSTVFVTSPTQTLSPFVIYVANSASLITFSLPTNFNQGDWFKVLGFGAGGWVINQNTGQQCFYGSSSTTLGSSGNITSTNSKAVIELTGMAANTSLLVSNTSGDISLN